MLTQVEGREARRNDVCRRPVDLVAAHRAPRVPHEHQPQCEHPRAGEPGCEATPLTLASEPQTNCWRRREHGEQHDVATQARSRRKEQSHCGGGSQIGKRPAEQVHAANAEPCRPTEPSWRPKLTGRSMIVTLHNARHLPRIACPGQQGQSQTRQPSHPPASSGWADRTPRRRSPAPSRGLVTLRPIFPVLRWLRMKRVRLRRSDYAAAGMAPSA